ncbi:hypothetical protein EDB81DRAFT_730894 [Dactylonectria macrodidyma]|uniref:Uncharacterized protein n=1 Tax=Dactylonectria macrodidyma TaxID=307937 RepID=A0A9P9DRP9_9HYPO|nr:hypothetical protein EDB81DRAFT_730894 [Dactylonectria macrodidyma]
MFDIPSSYPLRNVSDDDLKSLAKTLWSWNLCEPCQLAPGQEPCSPQPCPGMRWARMKSFFDYYENITASYVPDILAGTPPALRSHQDLFAIIKLLKENPDVTRSDLTATHFVPSGDDGSPTFGDQNRAFNLALRAMTTITCCLETRSLDTLETGLQPIPWKDDMSWTQFLSTTFPGPSYTQSGAEGCGDAASRRINDLITARRLIKVARLRFVPTDELKDHLKLNQQDGTIKLYRHTAFLKETLIASRTEARGHIPRVLATEVLNSIQKTLFPSTADAQILLRSLISKQNLDPDCLKFEPSTYQLESEGTLIYHYLEPRLVELYEELDNPTPRGLLKKWLERKSGARYVMMATLGGVAIAIVLGMLALGVSIFQAYVGWQQWQHPVET